MSAVREGGGMVDGERESHGTGKSEAGAAALIGAEAIADPGASAGRAASPEPDSGEQRTSPAPHLPDNTDHHLRWPEAVAITLALLLGGAVATGVFRPMLPWLG
ncbi:hypothetical protein [Catenulispora pinisilvae]|uniref:hypothetical protein n=1 Tax=Catenulispora pinisilvae TaxID=2705253 RepID=UPI0018923553|nr:hypothetical protein [Catenulispora pinisilvae]